jgi:membrane-associated phospholipid phosphatase
VRVAARRPSDLTSTESPTRSGLNPTDKIVIAYLSVITGLILIFSRRVDLWIWLCGLHASLIAAVILIARWPRKSGDLSQSRLSFFFRSWYIVGMIPIAYKELTYLIPRIHPHDLDSALAAIDYRIFITHPTVWLERLTSPALTEILQLVYSTYYFLPVILGTVLWCKGWFDKFNFWLFVVMLGFFLSYFGYLAVPAIGPRFLPSIVAAQTKPLTGVLLFQTIRESLDRFEEITRDCFPSGHTELTLLVLYYSRKFHRRTFWSLLPLGSGIIISTVYLRYHYVIDVIAGAALAAGIVIVVEPLYSWLGGKRFRTCQQ